MFAVAELGNFEDGKALPQEALPHHVRSFQAHPHSPASLWGPIPIRRASHLPRSLWITVLSISAALAVAFLVQRCVGRLRQTRGAARPARPTPFFRTHRSFRRLSEADTVYCHAEASVSRGAAGAAGAEGEDNAQATGDTVSHSSMLRSSGKLELVGQDEDETSGTLCCFGQRRRSGVGRPSFLQRLRGAFSTLAHLRAHGSTRDPAESAGGSTQTSSGAPSEEHSGRAGRRSSKSESKRAKERAKRNKALSSPETRRRLDVLRAARTLSGLDLAFAEDMSREDLLEFVKPRVMRKDESLAEFLAVGFDPELVEEEKIRRTLYYDQLALAEGDRLYEHWLWLRRQGAGAGWDEATGDDDVFK